MKRARSPHAPTKTVTMAADVRRDSVPARTFKDMPSLKQMPPAMAYTSPATSTIPLNEDGGRRPATTLPLNLIAHIMSYLDDVGDMARIARTSRLMYYMCLPQLYQRVNLHSYGEMRYVNGRPEGFGAGSPFMMALNGLCTKGHATLVQELKVWGKWQELGIDDFAKGRVPDTSMMLNIILRAATDKMTKLKSFSWELDCKPLKTLYQGLGTHNTLTTLTLRFPTIRVPRPSVIIPPMPNLRAFQLLDYDPLCYPDDLSMLFLGSKKLEDVRLHFSPRMRAEAENTMSLGAFFGRCYKADYKLQVKHFALQNWFGQNVLSFDQIFDDQTCTSATFIDTFGGNDPRTIFVDETWNAVPHDLDVPFDRIRVNEISPRHVEIMRKQSKNMKALYLISNAKRQKTGYTPASNASNGEPPTPNGDAAHSPYDPNKDPEWISLGKEYIHTIGDHHGSTLKHLLLSDVWAVPREDLAYLVRTCTQLEQLGLALDDVQHESIRLLCPFLPNLKCLRILENEQLRQHFALYTHEQRMYQMANELATRGPLHLEFICLADCCYKIGGLIEVPQENGTIEIQRQITMVDKGEAVKFEIWHLDTLDISVDPIAPFTK
ncbi:hypothetical protein CB0940_02483 [Cercospora beticola]|uniref:F-box domain-containing protein n=2 Tax=Cercospora beticola TaxID=122368 RepID=A0A2G5I2G1_CERBT|nr:hypothetical protein CB0940_02483 [Cercospora beticola]PIA98994.1 hypothetical protein CB0940_02483 [Cercospora beticola]